MSGFELKFYGVRGSAPLSHPDYIEYGGNTASLTLRTPENTLLFIDGGSGLKFAQNELDKQANKVWLILSHTHLDHILGIPMSKLPFINQLPGYEDRELNILGPKGLQIALRKVYDGHRLWPVIFQRSSDNKPAMSAVNYEKIVEYRRGKEIDIDKGLSITMIKGNHPVKGSVILYKFHLKEISKTIVYATDNEFDYIDLGKPNPQADRFKRQYLKFIKSCDLLIADGQYTKVDYPKFKGFGHSYPEQIVDLADQANVKEVIITHHHDYTDSKQRERESSISEYIAENNYKLSCMFAKEGLIKRFS